MERSPVIGWLFHIRILSLLMLLAHVDLYFIHHAYTFTATKGPSVQLVFGFEYSILIIMIVNILIKVSKHKYFITLLFQNSLVRNLIGSYLELYIFFVYKYR